jgi:hypothetical protein
MGIWLGFIAYAIFLAPTDNPQTLDLILNLSRGQWRGINPFVICLFNLMGVLPFIYASFLIIDGRNQKIMATPFVFASFLFGAFSLLPYFAFRETNTQFRGEKTLTIKILDSRLFSVITTLSCLSLIVIAITKGDWQNFISQWQNSKFINVMSLDFCLLSLLFPAIVNDDMAQRGLENKSVLMLITLTPLLGTLLYTCFRPPLNTNQTQSLPVVSKAT